MKTTSKSEKSQDNDEMLPEYRFDYRKARPNRFAPKIPEGSRIVILEPDIAEVFTTPGSVNTILRALITTMPKRQEADTST
ncbi:MAG: hypothetical protein Q8M92_02290 [Candidatus Subteraquimicrobiales bacterium]|nr:hypothetical protein [Candidatus Subteraquimicrobiales bacterium]